VSVTLAQPIVFAGGSAITQGFSLGSPPTAGNLIVVGFSGNDNGIAPGTMTSLFADSSPPQSAVYTAYRRVQGGDLAGPYTWTGLIAGWDAGGFIAELAGAGTPTVWAEGSGTWTLAGTTQVANGTVNTLAGSMIFELYVIYTAASTIAQSASDAISQSFAIVNHGPLATSASSKQYQLIATRSDGSPSTANPVATMPNVTTANGLQSQFGIVIPAAAVSGTVGNGSVASCIGNTNIPVFADLLKRRYQSCL
jgi:hypothetical protein